MEWNERFFNKDLGLCEVTIGQKCLNLVSEKILNMLHELTKTNLNYL